MNLGIDLGTTKVASVLVDPSTRSVLASASRVTSAALLAREGHSEQDPAKIEEALDCCIESLPAESRAKVSAIGVTGQMHGVLLWNSSDKETSPLITWEDQRCNHGDFLADLRRVTKDAAISSGFGCASLAWLARFEASRFARFENASTVHDYIVARMCNLARPVTDYTDAAGWGFFDILDHTWEIAKARKAGIPVSILPEAVPPGSVAGLLGSEYSRRWGIPAGVPVVAAIGDNQASLFCTLENPESQLALTLGTGGQLSAITQVVDSSLFSGTFEYRPYLDGSYAAVAASLCGGSAYAWLAKAVETWIRDMGLEPPAREDIFAALNELGLQCLDSTLSINPHFLGERNNPGLSGSISGIGMNNFSLGNLAAALARGIVENLKSMLPEQLFEGRTEIVGSGNAIRRSPLIQKSIEDVFKLPLVLADGEEEAACGTALLAAGARVAFFA